MQEIKRRYIDWEKTGKRLQNLREHDDNLRRYVCRYHKTRTGDCDGNGCESCEFDMDNHISRAELAEVLNTSINVVTNWEGGRTAPNLEDLLYFLELCKVELEAALVFTN